MEKDTVLPVVGVKRKAITRTVKRTSPTVVNTTVCKTHGVEANDYFVAAWKNGEQFKCKDCCKVSCDTCGLESPAYGNYNCIKCSRRRAAGNAVKNITMQDGERTFRDTTPCPTHTYEECYIRCSGNRQYLCCRKFSSLAQGSKRRTTTSAQDLAPSECTASKLMNMYGDECETCGEQVFLSLIPYNPRGFSTGRIDHTIGYVDNNYKAQHLQCNYITGIGTVEEARARLEAIYQFNIVRNGIIDSSLPVPYYKNFDSGEKGSWCRDFFKWRSEKWRSHRIDCDWLTDTWIRNQICTIQRGICTCCGSMILRDDMSLDQTIAGNGYSPDRCTIMHAVCNKGKGVWPIKDLMELATTVHNKFFTDLQKA